MLLALRLLLIFVSSDSIQALSCSFRMTQFSPTLYHNTEETFIYLLTIMPFNVYAALSQGCHRYVTARIMSNLLTYKVFNRPPSKSYKSHPLSQYAHLFAVVQVSIACSQKENPCTYFLYVSRQLSYCTYLSLGVEYLKQSVICYFQTGFNYAFSHYSIPCRTFQKHFTRGGSLTIS